MSNVAGKAYAMNVITPMTPLGSAVQRLIFAAVRCFPSQLSTLLGLHFIHFARWVIIRRKDWPPRTRGNAAPQYDYMLFMSNFNGTWDQYIDAFSDGLPTGLDFLWYAAVKYPHSIPVTTFKDYISYNQIDTDYYYNATPGAAQRDIKAAFQVMREVKALAALHPTASPAEFAASFRAALGRLQNCLGSHGIGPTASLDTQNAERNQREALDEARRLPAAVH